MPWTQTAHVDVSVANTFTVGMQLLLATACGLLIASLYYAQPLTGLIAESLGMPARSAGLLVTVPAGLGAALPLFALLYFATGQSEPTGS